jgi:hypothetical protein
MPHLTAGITFLLLTILIIDIVFLLSDDDKDDLEQWNQPVLVTVQVVKKYRESQKRKHPSNTEDVDENGAVHCQKK